MKKLLSIKIFMILLFSSMACGELEQINEIHPAEKEVTNIVQLSDTDIKAYKEKCLKGDMTGCYQVGRAYGEGNGVKENLGLAKDFFDLACEGGNYRSCGKLAFIYMGEKLFMKQPDYVKAYHFAKIACEHKIGRGCDALYYIYNKGKGIAKNHALAKEYAQKAMKYYHSNCDQEVNKSDYQNVIIYEDKGFDCRQIAWHYVYDENIKIDYEQEIYYYKRACGFQDADSCHTLGFIYELGKETKRDLKKAERYYARACDLGDNNSCSTLTIWYEYGEEGVINKDVEKVIQYYKKMCERGDKDSCKDVNRAIHSKRCYEQNSGADCYKLGDYYLKRKDDDESKSRAKRLFKMSCELGYKEACQK